LQLHENTLITWESLPEKLYLQYPGDHTVAHVDDIVLNFTSRRFLHNSIYRIFNNQTLYRL